MHLENELTNAERLRPLLEARVPRCLGASFSALGVRSRGGLLSGGGLGL